jgi:DNA-binding transcriptional regulator YiaG
MSFAKAIKSERERLGLTQEECAAVLDVSPRKLWAWESGKSVPTKTEQHGVIPILQKAKPARK